MALLIIIPFCVIVGSIVVWAVVATVRSHLHWWRASRDLDHTIAKVSREQALLSEGLVPEFAMPGDIEDLKRRYLSGEDIPLRWRNPGRQRF